MTPTELRNKNKQLMQMLMMTAHNHIGLQYYTLNGEIYYVPLVGRIPLTESYHTWKEALEAAFAEWEKRNANQA
jgi:hypothetical protein